MPCLGCRNVNTANQKNGKLKYPEVFAKTCFVVAVLIVCIIATGIFRHFRHSTTYFLRSVNETEVRLMLDTLKAFDKAMVAANLTYFLVGGSLIGTYRHHGFVPWDDDIDVMANASQKQEVLAALSKMEPDYKVYPTPNYSWKFYYTNIDTLPFHSFRWPYVDLFFFVENRTHIWFEVSKFEAELKAEKTKIFPTRRRPFENISLPVPCNLDIALSYFGDVLSNCATNTFNHKNEFLSAPWSWSMVPCSSLEDRYSFVRHQKVEAGWNETLVFRNKSIRSIITPHYC